MSEKVHKREFLKRVASRTGMSEKDVNKFFDAFLAELSDIMVNNGTLTLINFGKFYLSKHPGHPMPFSKDDSKITSYYTLHFSAVRQLSAKLGERRELLNNSKNVSDE